MTGEGANGRSPAAWQPATAPEARDKAPAPACGRRAEDYHPLEIFPFFRRFRPSLARDLLYTFIWNCALGLAFWLVAMGVSARFQGLHLLSWNLVFANAIGFSIHGLFVLGTRLGIDAAARRAGAVAITVYYSGVSTLGVVIGFALVAAWLDAVFFGFLANPRWLAAMTLSSVLVSVILATIFFGRARQREAEALLERERSRAERVEREAAAANLRALQAQIEPHFLFNTLANVSSLIDADPARSRDMLEKFIRFLRASLAATRERSTTLGAEGELIAAYLEVLRIRMGPRLRYAIEIDPAVAAYEVPPMLLQPVVENAIRHGLEPQIAGGEVRLSARREGGSVVVEVADTGAGFNATTFGGVGLSNLRDRLRLLYGERAALSIGENPGGGTRVRLTLPA